MLADGQRALRRHSSCARCFRDSTTTCVNACLISGQSSLGGLQAWQELTRRTDELFNIIVDYPESLAALEDLKVNQCA